MPVEHFRCSLDAFQVTEIKLKEMCISSSLFFQIIYGFVGVLLAATCDVHFGIVRQQGLTGRTKSSRKGEVSLTLVP